MNKTKLKQVIEEEFQKLLNEYKYKLYHKSFTQAAEEARKVAEKKGFEIDEENWTTEVAFGGKYTRARPSIGKSNSFSVKLEKNGKPTRRHLHFQVYGMESGNFELNAYVS
tara:strand:- start:100 stop:432 length:333 start_codon:yes stop_codon:yes gene_type:complete